MASFTFTQIKQYTIENEIIGRLREAIISGQFVPGAHLNETVIAKQMSVSRIPIREAIKKLEQEGLVVRHPNKGVDVISFTAQDVREIFSLRARIEEMAFEWAIPKLTSEDLDQLHALLAEQKVTIDTHDYDQLTRLDLGFHEYICLKAGHSRLLKIWYELHAQGQMLLNLRFRLMPDFTPRTVLRDHQAILAAIEDRDVALAVRLTNEISERVIGECIQTLDSFMAEPEAM